MHFAATTCPHRRSETVEDRGKTTGDRGTSSDDDDVVSTTTQSSSSSSSFGSFSVVVVVVVGVSLNSSFLRAFAVDGARSEATSTSDATGRGSDRADALDDENDDDDVGFAVMAKRKDKHAIPNE